MRIVIASAAVLLIGAGIGCGESDQEDVECEEIRTDLEFDEESTFGYSAGEAIETVELTGEADLTWTSYADAEAEEESETTVQWEVSQDFGSVREVEEVVPPEGEEAGLNCYLDYVGVETELDIETADGYLDETLDIELRAHEADRVGYSPQRRLHEIQGALSPEMASDDTLIAIHGTLSPDKSSGSVRMNRYVESGDDQDVESGDDQDDDYASPWQHLGNWSDEH